MQLPCLPNDSRGRYGKFLEERYGITIDGTMETLEIMDQIAKKRGFVLRGQEIDYLRTAQAILNDFREGKLGRITLETPQEQE